MEAGVYWGLLLACSVGLRLVFKGAGKKDGGAAFDGGFGSWWGKQRALEMPTMVFPCGGVRASGCCGVVLRWLVSGGTADACPAVGLSRGRGTGNVRQREVKVSKVRLW